MMQPRQLAVVLLFVFALWLQPKVSAQTPPIRILPMGDSITYGSGGTANLGGYRGPLYTSLTNAGYNVDYVGNQTDNSSSIPDRNHEGHSGWRIDQLDANVTSWFNSIADPDVILLHIGTNDFGQGVDTPNAINRLNNLITKMATLRPYAHIIVTNLMEREEPRNTAIQDQFNPRVQSIVNDHVAVGHLVTFLDMRSAVPLSDMPDSLHPNQTGYDKMANTWLPAIQAVITPNGDSASPALVRARGNTDRTHVDITFSKPVADSAANLANYAIDGGLTISAATLDSSKRIVTLTTSSQTLGSIYTVTVNGVVDRIAPTPKAIVPNSTGTFQTAIPRGYQNHVPESSAYTLVYSLDIPNNAAFRTRVPYNLDNRNGVGPFNRVAYYLELQRIDGELEYVWASMDAFTNDANLIGVPNLATGAQFQQSVSNLNVISNVPGVVTGTGLDGNLEFWPTNYAAENTPAPGVPGASDSLYDFGDHPTTPGSYGSMQLHNTAAGQTVFAFNNWGATGAAGDADLGIGNDPAPVNNGLDWTFHHNAAGYSVKTLQVLVQTTGDVTRPTLASATSTPGRTQIVVTFSEPLAEGSVKATNFSLNNGVAVLTARLAANQRDVILGTTPQPEGIPLTLTVSGVRDTSSSANLIAPGSSIAVSAPTLPPEILANIGAAAAGYQLVCSAELPEAGNLNAAGANAYFYDDRVAQHPFSRVAYYLELQQGTGSSQYVWASMDAFTAARAKLGVPIAASGASFQQNVTNLDVISNVAGVVTGTTATGGNIEFWPSDYSAPNALSVPNASASTYDTGDTRGTGTGYGSMQIHNHDANQPVMSINHFGVDGNILDIGIGAQATNNPDWTFAANARNYTRRILHVLVLPGNTIPADLITKVPEAANYQLAYSLNIPATGNINSIVPSVNDGAQLGPFSRVAYYFELQTGADTPNYIWTSMDAFTTNGGRIGVPTAASGAIFQQNVTNLNVFSNVTGIVTGTGLAGGNIEFWPTNYSAPNAANVPNASGTLYDFGDSRTNSGTYGSMQVHNHDASQTLFAFNNWGAAATATTTFCLGIGNNPAPVNGGVDWTFSDNGPTYSSRILRVYVLTGDSTPPTVLSASPSTTLNRLIVTFNEPVSDSSAVAANFSIPGLTVTGAATLPDQRQIALFTSPQTPGTVYTVNVSGVRDRARGNLIAPGATTNFTAFTPPAVFANVPEISDYKLINLLAIPSASPQWNFNPIPYSVDESKFGPIVFDRVAYLLELDGNWVYTSFDKVTSDITKVGVPTLGVSSTAFQQNITNLNVASNVAGIVTGTGLSGGNIEFWGGNYSAANALNIPNASAATRDFGDQMDNGGHGSMQVHNHDASQVIFAYNNWGSNANQTSDTGIGSRSTGDPDWTFSNSASTYTTRNLYVLVRPSSVPSGVAPILWSQPVSRSVPSGSNVTFAVTASGGNPLTYQWRFNNTPIIGATNSWLDVNGVTAGQTGTYDVIVTAASGASTTSAGATLSLSGGNVPPTFSGFSFTTQRNVSASIPRSSVTAKANDLNNDSLVVSATSATSTQGGAVSLGATDVVYTPSAGYLGVDSFGVTISDGHGGTVNGTVSVTVFPLAGNDAGYTTLGFRADGKLDALFYGAPGKNYEVQRNTNLANPTGWQTIATVPAGDDGSIPFTDPNPPAGNAFYRTRTTVP